MRTCNRSMVIMACLLGGIANLTGWTQTVIPVTGASWKLEMYYNSHGVTGVSSNTTVNYIVSSNAIVTATYSNVAPDLLTATISNTLKAVYANDNSAALAIFPSSVTGQAQVSWVFEAPSNQVFTALSANFALMKNCSLWMRLEGDSTEQLIGNYVGDNFPVLNFLDRTSPGYIGQKTRRVELIAKMNRTGGNWWDKMFCRVAAKTTPGLSVSASVGSVPMSVVGSDWKMEMYYNSHGAPGVSSNTTVNYIVSSNSVVMATFSNVAPNLLAATISDTLKAVYADNNSAGLAIFPNAVKGAAQISWVFEAPSNQVFSAFTADVASTYFSEWKIKLDNQPAELAVTNSTGYDVFFGPLNFLDPNYPYFIGSGTRRVELIGRMNRTGNNWWNNILCRVGTIVSPGLRVQAATVQPAAVSPILADGTDWSFTMRGLSQTGTGTNATRVTVVITNRAVATAYANLPLGYFASSTSDNLDVFSSVNGAITNYGIGFVRYNTDSTARTNSIAWRFVVPDRKLFSALTVNVGSMTNAWLSLRYNGGSLYRVNSYTTAADFDAIAFARESGVTGSIRDVEVVETFVQSASSAAWTGGLAVKPSSPLLSVHANVSSGGVLIRFF